MVSGWGRADAGGDVSECVVGVFGGGGGGGGTRWVGVRGRGGRGKVREEVRVEGREEVRGKVRAAGREE